MPGVYLTTTEFLDDAKSAAKDRGMPGLRMVALPANTYYRARASKEELMPIATKAFPAIADDLIRPLTAGEAHPRQAEKQSEAAHIKVTGRDYPEAYQKVNDLFLDNHWSDGLPIVPPTVKLVNAMLAATTRSRQEVLGQTAPKQGTATVEKVAVNAVMAGAKPEYLPVILAAMDGFLDSHYDLTHVQASTGSFTPIVVISGPLGRELGFNSGIGMLGHGFRANSTVGRALRLALLNIGQTWPAVNDMALTGRLESYTFFTFSEDNEKSPWEPYAVSLGYKPEQSTVTVATVGNPIVLGGGAVAPWTGQGVIDQVVARISTGAGFNWFHSQTIDLVLIPDCAVDLASSGYTRKSLQQYLYEKSRIPFEKLSPATVQLTREAIADGRIRPENAQIFQDNLKPGGRVPIVQTPDDFHIFVAGGSPGYDLLFTYPGPNWANQTKPIRDATLTKAGQ
ncbi:MAG TPA: UGSC family (seleno)protein [Candidatus Acidoferrum sp.]|nr:UGSC family (seleno)protein [Candidatus Acidoferrum sp.]